jgi:hypothetical protein
MRCVAPILYAIALAPLPSRLLGYAVPLRQNPSRRIMHRQLYPYFWYRRRPAMKLDQR